MQLKENGAFYEKLNYFIIEKSGAMRERVRGEIATGLSGGDQSGSDQYEYIGDQDITTHVNFSALDYWGRRKGLEVGGFTNQAHFLQGLGLTARLRIREENGMEERDRSQLRTFLWEMGQKFNVLIQRKGIGQVGLSGLLFSNLLR
jgi:SAM-dependent MidA family methyltransferase